jgi:hypothetical protein
MKPLFPAVLAVLFAVGCALPQESSAPESKMWYGLVHLYSDPPGAHIYNGGEYWGETTADKPVARSWWNNARTGWATLTLKKRGYKATSYYMTIRLDYATKEEAQLHPQKVVIVMDTE